MQTYRSLEQWFSWMDDLSAKDYVVIDHFFQPKMYAEIRSFFLGKLPNFTEAGIGTNADNQINKNVRGDFTYWLDRKRDMELQSFWNLVDEILYMFNRLPPGAPCSKVRKYTMPYYRPTKADSV